MCFVSYVGDGFTGTLPQRDYWPTVQPLVTSPAPIVINQSDITREEFNALKRDIEELKLLLQAAKRFDEKTGQPDCETEEKVALIKRLADIVKVDMAEVFGK